MAFSKLDSSITEKTTKKTSAELYDKVLNLLYVSYPAVSHKLKLIILPSTAVYVV